MAAAPARIGGAPVLQLEWRETGCPARIRTSIDGIRIRSLTIRRRGNRRVPLGAESGAVKTWTAPTANDAVPVTFTQAIGANDALRTGTYSKSLTFTLSTTTP